MGEWNEVLGRSPQDRERGEARLGVNALHLETRRQDYLLGKNWRGCRQGSLPAGWAQVGKVSSKSQREQEESWKLSMGGG